LRKKFNKINMWMLFYATPAGTKGLAVSPLTGRRLVGFAQANEHRLMSDQHCVQVMAAEDNEAA